MNSLEGAACLLSSVLVCYTTNQGLQTRSIYYEFKLRFCWQVRVLDLNKFVFLLRLLDLIFFFFDKEKYLNSVNIFHVEFRGVVSEKEHF